MRQKTQQGLGPGLGNPFESDEDDVPPGERITPVDSERGRALARAAQAAILKAERELDAERTEERGSRAERRTLPEDVASDDTRELGGFESEADARKEFDTVPGGGVNRESGGRAIARAYVSPKTPMRLKEGRLALISVDVDPEATSDSRSFPTEKALRAGSLVPPPTIPAEARPRKSRAALPLIIALGTAGILTATIVVVGERESPTVPVVNSSVAATTVEIPPPVKTPALREPTLLPTEEKVTAAPAASAPTAAPPARAEKNTPPSTKMRNADPERAITNSKPAASSPKKATGQEDVWLE